MNELYILISHFIITAMCRSDGVAIMDHRRNWAFGMDGRQAMTAENAGPHRALDGNYTNNWSGHSCSLTKKYIRNNWWFVDLGQSIIVQEVYIFTRAETVAKTLAMRRFYIEVLNKPQGDMKTDSSDFVGLCHHEESELPYGFGKMYRCIQDLQGRYVRIRKASRLEDQYLSLCEVEVYGSKPRYRDTHKTNFAMGMKTEQSSTYHLFGAYYAVDNMMEITYQCTHTNLGDTKPWWMVYLAEMVYVEEVFIANRKYYGDRLRNFLIAIYDKYPHVRTKDGVAVLGSAYVGECYSQTQPLKNSEQKTFRCARHLLGNYVRISKEGSDILTLCEVRVFGYKEDHTRAWVRENWALKLTATQSSTWRDGVASRAVDGNSNHFWYQSRSCTHTETSGDPSPWWMVDLKQDIMVKEVFIVNRGDYYGNRLRDFFIEVLTYKEEKSPELCFHQLYPQGTGRNTRYICYKDIIGRFVRIRKTTYILTLCEVQVFGSKKDMHRYNWALHKHATQSSTWGRQTPDKAVDGNTMNVKDACTVTLNNIYQWWMVDLGQFIYIEEVYIINIADCCDNRLQHFVIQVFNAPNAYYHNTPIRTRYSHKLVGLCHYQEKPLKRGEKRVFPCESYLFGRYVGIQKTGFSKTDNTLSLCEVEVYGKHVGQIENRQNWALGMETKQSKILGSASPSRAVDGRIMNNYNMNSCSTTGRGETFPYWEVDLGVIIYVEEVAIVNRADCCGDLLTQFKIYVKIKSYGIKYLCYYQKDAVKTGAYERFFCRKRVQGQYVRIDKDPVEAADEYLTLCEVEVYGRRKERNWALGKNVGQSMSEEFRLRDPSKLNGTADLAVDGDLTNNVVACSTTSSRNHAPWWMVNLERSVLVHAVLIITRADCCEGQLKNFTIQVLRTPTDNPPRVCYHQDSSVPNGYYMKFPCDNSFLGQYVKILKYDDKHFTKLSLCEVEVYGTAK